jgi:hypothetical protein
MKHARGYVLRDGMQVFLVISLVGTGIVQYVASSSSQYAINKRYNKRTWTLILGPIISLFAFLPSARSNRVLNIIGLAGTNYSCLYFFVAAISKGVDRKHLLLCGPHTRSVSSQFIICLAAHGVVLEGITLCSVNLIRNASCHYYAE